MTGTNDVNILIVSPTPELGAGVNASLRGRGVVAQVEWVRGADAAAAELKGRAFDLVFCEIPAIEPAPLVALASKSSPPIPVIGLTESIDTESLTKGIEAGLRDLVVIEHRVHLAAVVRREVAALNGLRDFESVRVRADRLEVERDTLFRESGDALARVEDGILVGSNEAWGELFGANNALEGTPIMDLFKADGHKALRAALRGGDPKAVELVAKGDGDVDVPVKVALRAIPGDANGQQIEIAIRSGMGQRTLAEELDRAQREDRDTGMLNRDAFVEQLSANPDVTLVMVRIDHFAKVVEQMGVLGSNAVAVQFAQLLRRFMNTGVVAGRVEGTLFGILMPEADREVAEEWCKRIRAAAKDMAFEHNKRSTALTASFGIRLPGATDPTTMIDDAIGALRGARSSGGDQIEVFVEAREVEAASTVSDTEWVKRIDRAFKHGHFRFALQPVASLHGEESQMSDLLLRMQDPEHGEILPGEFLPAAEREGVVTRIDQWVIGQAITMLHTPDNQRKGNRLIVRLSDQSLKGGALLKWLVTQVQAHPLKAGQLIFEVSEKQADTYLKDTRALATIVGKLKCGLLMSRFGGSATSPRMLEQFKLDYVKLDIDVLGGITSDKKRQDALKSLLTRVKDQGIPTIAPQVEDANSMALLWQLGVDFVQGNYLQEPEVVISD